ncbi:hypothetical protein [Kordiimonas sp.]|uniref:hypothetical protein n=1 Tax=Kordiimonas sp. TaxID=1970157 RepID=UPI003A92A930
MATWWKKLTDGLLSNSTGAGGASARTWTLIGIPIAIAHGKASRSDEILLSLQSQLIELRQLLEADEVPVKGRVKCDAILAQLSAETGIDSGRVAEGNNG